MLVAFSSLFHPMQEPKHSHLRQISAQPHKLQAAFMRLQMAHNGIPETSDRGDRPPPSETVTSIRQFSESTHNHYLSTPGFEFVDA
jgi:hypothetical protein